MPQDDSNSNGNHTLDRCRELPWVAVAVLPTFLVVSVFFGEPVYVRETGARGRRGADQEELVGHDLKLVPARHGLLVGGPEVVRGAHEVHILVPPRNHAHAAACQVLPHLGAVLKHRRQDRVLDTPIMGRRQRGPWHRTGGPGGVLSNTVHGLHAAGAQ